MRGFRLIVAAAALASSSCAVNTATPPADMDAAFKAWESEFVADLMAFYPEWAIQAGKYDHAAQVTVPDAAWRARELAWLDQEAKELARFDASRLDPLLRADHGQIANFLKGQRWERIELRDWEWNAALQGYTMSYNPAGAIDAVLNTEYAPLDQRLRVVLARLDQVPALYQAVQANLKRPTREHTQLAIQQNQGTLQLLGDALGKQAQGSGLAADEKALFAKRLEAARAATTAHVAWLTQLEPSLTPDYARSFRLGRELYLPKFGYDIQSGFTIEQLFERAQRAKEQLHADMEANARKLWPKYFPGKGKKAVPMPKDRKELIAKVIAKVSEKHSKPEKFVDDVRAQIPALEKFVREKKLLEQDPSKALIVRETPPFNPTRGVAIASIDAPGPFNPGAPTYYNVNPMGDFSPERAESFLREYNNWMMQILNIHEAVPGHYTQLLHSNRSPSVVKSLLGSGPMIEGWACYVQRMMLENGWGANEPEMWLMLEKFEMRAVVNTILDYSVHVLGMSEEDALKLLMNEAFQTETEARGKWRRVQLSQVQLTSYFAGYAEIFEFREARKAQLGPQFDLAAFHNKFLSYGSVPVKVIKGLMSEPETALAAR
ncbi:MAG TPA: DUF885 domain-containing protein [Verrucomicrobiae bacterium]|nr:DUF885 domain-containing protein [Verrucomicrobiae bacterium]